MNLTDRPILQKPDPEEAVVQGHPRGHDCPSCRGRRNRRKGQERQRAARKALGITPQFHGQAANEEAWGESPDLPGLRFEVKSGGQIPVWFTKAIAQVEAARPHMGAIFKPAVVLSPSGTSKQYLVVELSDMTNLARAWREVGQGSQIKTLIRQIRKALDAIEGLAR